MTQVLWWCVLVPVPAMDTNIFNAQYTRRLKPNVISKPNQMYFNVQNWETTTCLALSYTK
jgi:hypothetical protein